MKRFLPLFFTLMILVPATSYSQGGYILRRALNRQVEKEIDTILDKKAQEERDKARERERLEKEQKAKEAPAAVETKETETSSDDASEPSGPVNLGSLFGGKVTLKYNEEYKFTSRIYMVSETYDKDDVVKMDFYMFYSSSSPSIGVETSTVTDENGTPLMAKMVMDAENKSFLILTDANGMKMGMISEIPDENSTVIGPDGKPVKNYTPPTFTKTGNTKQIAGYKCDEYTYKDTDNKTSGKVWFTKDAKLKIDRRGWNNSKMSYYYGSPEFKDGIILANEAYDNKGKLQTKSETKEINENFPHDISVTGYSLTQMNMNQKK